jgi:hypothetical protein
MWRVVVFDLETSKEEAKSPLKGCEYKPKMGCDAEREIMIKYSLLILTIQCDTMTDDRHTFMFRNSPPKPVR